MKRLLLSFGASGAAALMLVGCSAVIPDSFDQPAEDPVMEEPASSESSSVVAPPATPAERRSVVLVDQSFETSADVTGAARLKAMRVQKLTGTVRNARLHFTLSRNGQNEGVAGVVAYSGDLTENGGGVIFDSEWRSFPAVGATWIGNGKCAISQGSELLSGKDETVEAEYSLSALPISSGKPDCTDESFTVDLESRLNATGIALGFLPTNQGYHLKVEMTYEGDLTMKPW